VGTRAHQDVLPSTFGAVPSEDSPDAPVHERKAQSLSYAQETGRRPVPRQQVNVFPGQLFPANT
jgi:hypothetical protein